jgi:hypothetical protein
MYTGWTTASKFVEKYGLQMTLLRWRYPQRSMRWA